MTGKFLDRLRRGAKTLKAGYVSGSSEALTRNAIAGLRSDGADLKYVDYLHMISRTLDFDNAETVGLLLNVGVDSSQGSDAEVVDIKTRRGIPTLHQAALFLIFLLEYRADLLRRAIAASGVPKIRAILQKWADRMLGQVVEHGVF